jgi:predicted cupin superfamily sugar epimerase
MLLLYPDGRSRTVTLGNDLLKGDLMQYAVKKGIWQGSFLLEGGRFALLGTTMSPAYDHDDYIHGNREELQERYPDHKEMISRLTD